MKYFVISVEEKHKNVLNIKLLPFWNKSLIRTMKLRFNLLNVMQNEKFYALVYILKVSSWEQTELNSQLLSSGPSQYYSTSSFY